MKVNLVVADGVHQGKVIPIKLAQFVIGRDPQCHLRPSSVAISKRHCAILVKGDKVVLRDLDSTNGTFVNEQPIKGQVELHDEDKLKIGPLAFTVKVESNVKLERVSVSKPTPVPPPADPGEDDEIAAMLLDVQGEGGTESGSGGDPAKISMDSTVLDVMPGTVPEAPAAEGAPAGDKKEEKGAKAKLAEANTSLAAKAILEKYLRRPRS
jgi:pSer/pThr/pTyr-binding forkhead associated (FHA) protein